MRYLNLILITLTISIFNACGPSRIWYNESCAFNPDIIKNDQKLYFQYYADNHKYGENNKSNSLLYEFNLLTKKWEKIASRKNMKIKILNDLNSSKIEELYSPFDIKNKKDIIEVSWNEYITFSQDKAIVKNIDSHQIVFTQILPSVNNILNDLSLSFDNIDKVEYLPFITKQYLWDRERYVMMVATNKHGDSRGYDYMEYYISLKYTNERWEYELINIEKEAYLSKYSSNIGFYTHVALDGMVNLHYTHGVQEYFVLDNDTIKIKALFGDIYNKKLDEKRSSLYAFTGNEHYNARRGFNYFDAKGNMHLFYRKIEDIRAKNYNYFWYGYFEKENPNVALYEQKILWE